ncbi:MAG: 5'-methylthioadenosine/adenosylhomocysteine nucleosidase [Alloprevotella sp.]
MTLALINAMHKEHEQLVQLLSDTKKKKLGPFRAVEGKYGECDVVLMESGIGKVNAAIGAAELLRHYRLRAIINTGVAGGIDPTVGVMDVVVGDKVAYHDVDCGPENKPGQVQGLPLFFQSCRRLLKTATELPDTGTKIHSGLICSGDQFITDPTALQTIKQRFPEALAVDMESGALAQVCHLYKIPFLSFRIISDTPGVENHFDQYLNFWDTMADRSFGVTKALLEAVTDF